MNKTKEVIRIEKDDILLSIICSRNIHLEGSAYVESIKPTTRYGKTYKNICLKDIQFDYNNKIYELSHVWLQEVDYPNEFNEIMEVDELYAFSFTTYQYRHGERYQGKGHKRGGRESDKFGLTIDWIEVY